MRLANSIKCRVGVNGSRVLCFSMWEGEKLWKLRLGEIPALTESESVLFRSFTRSIPARCYGR
ncbi:hypothetical protein [Aestuariivirga sp.]|jgi:hypothetical protein|uniref:hypothetical protein n=1 Tax=Aestuariivirga sp. TaxID=2650926 RepID=UPI00378365DB